MLKKLSDLMLNGLKIVIDMQGEMKNTEREEGSIPGVVEDVWVKFVLFLCFN